MAANPGFAYDYQLVNVADYQGRGESEPQPYYYQNLGEAEYIVAVYMFMRLLGYPAASISILTTYNGQKDLLRDVIEQRCARNPMFGRPHKVRYGRGVNAIECAGGGVRGESCGLRVSAEGVRCMGSSTARHYGVHVCTV